MPPGCSEYACAPRARSRRSSSTANNAFAVFGAPVRDPRVVRRALEVRIVEIDVGEPVPGRAQHHDARAFTEHRQEQLREQEVAHVVRSDLELEPVGGLALRTRHHARVLDEHVEVVVGRAELPREPTHVGERREVQRHELEPRVRDGRADARRRRLAPLGVAHGHRDGGTVRGERPGGLLPQPGGRTGHEDPGVGEIDPVEDLVGRGPVVEAHRRSLAEPVVRAPELSPAATTNRKPADVLQVYDGSTTNRTLSVRLRRGIAAGWRPR